MTRVIKHVSEWLRKPQRTRGDDLLLAPIIAALVWLIGYLGGLALDALGLVSFDNTVPLWVAAIGAGAALLLGLFLGRRTYTFTSQTNELYTEHLRDALRDLRRLTAGELPDFQIRDYVESGLFQPAHRLLTTRGRDRGDVRFSILHPDENDGSTLRMCGDKEGPYPALGHSMEGRQEFSIGIDGSFSGLTYRTGKPQYSNKLSEDDRWEPHPMAKKGREYESIISVPLIWAGKTDGVLNVIGVNEGAFDASDQTYVALLGAVIDVARSVAGQWD
jgi:GAF domain-containing protein